MFLSLYSAAISLYQVGISFKSSGFPVAILFPVILRASTMEKMLLNQNELCF